MLGGPQEAGARLEGQSLRVAVPQLPDGIAGERIIAGNRAIRVDAEDFAGQRRYILRGRLVLGIPHRKVKLVVGPPDHPAAVVGRGTKHVAQQDQFIGQRTAVNLEARKSAAPVSIEQDRVANIDPIVTGEAGVEFHPQNAAFPIVPYRRGAVEVGWVPGAQVQGACANLAQCFNTLGLARSLTLGQL